MLAVKSPTPGWLVSGENVHRVTRDENTVTRRPLLQKVLPSDDSESDPLKVVCFRVSSFLMSNKECGFSTHPAPSLMTQLIAAVPSCSPHYDSVITDCTCFSFPLSLLCLFDRSILCFPPLESSLCPPWSNIPELLLEKVLVDFSVQTAALQGRQSVIYGSGLCDWLKRDIIMAGITLSQFQNYNRCHAKFPCCYVTKWMVGCCIEHASHGTSLSTGQILGINFSSTQ